MVNAHNGNFRPMSTSNGQLFSRLGKERARFLSLISWRIVPKELGCDFSKVIPFSDFGMIFCEVQKLSEHVKISFNHPFIEILCFNVGHRIRPLRAFVYGTDVPGREFQIHTAEALDQLDRAVLVPRMDDSDVDHAFEQLDDESYACVNTRAFL